MARSHLSAGRRGGGESHQGVRCTTTSAPRTTGTTRSTTGCCGCRWSAWRRSRAQELPVEQTRARRGSRRVATTIENLESTTIFFRPLHQLSEEKQKEEVRRERRRYHETFRSMIVEGQQGRAFRDDVTADLAVDYFFGSVHPAIRSPMRHPHRRLPYQGFTSGCSSADCRRSTPGRTRTPRRARDHHPPRRGRRRAPVCPGPRESLTQV